MRTYKNEKRIIVKDFSKLENYGFVKQGNCYLFYTGNTGKYGSNVYTISVVCCPHRHSNKDHFVNVSSYSAITLFTICEMYKDGIIEIVNSRNSDLQLRIDKKEKQIEKLKNDIEELKKGLEK